MSTTINCIYCNKIVNIPFTFREIKFCDIQCCRDYYKVQKDVNFLSSFKIAVNNYKKELDKIMLMNNIKLSADCSSIQPIACNNYSYEEIAKKYELIHVEYNLIPINHL